MAKRVSLAVFLVSALVLAAPVVDAGAIHDAGLFTTALAGNDDGSTGLVGLGFLSPINFYGTSVSSLYVNNNGNVTFDAPLATFTPFGLAGTGRKILAPYFGDVDTRAGATVKYGTGTIGSHAVFGVNWIDVGYYAFHTDKLNSFQLIITDRSDTGAGNFDFEFNYDRVLWETGDASGGSSGLGGFPARMGWSNGSGTSFELAGSGVTGSFLDGNGVSGLIYNSLNSNIDGQYIFEVRNGLVEPPPEIPEPGTIGLLAAGLAGLRALGRRKQA